MVWCRRLIRLQYQSNQRADFTTNEVRYGIQIKARSNILISDINSKRIQERRRQNRADNVTERKEEETKVFV